jgi:alpha-L-arabinofuranosidase
MNKPKWLEVGEQTTRHRSKKQESRIAKELKGRTTINSGATFGENDVTTDIAEIEAKTTTKNSYSIKLDDWNKLVSKSKKDKFPIMVIDFENDKKSLAVLNYEDLKYLINCVNG